MPRAPQSRWPLKREVPLPVSPLFFSHGIGPGPYHVSPWPLLPLPLVSPHLVQAPPPPHVLGIIWRLSRQALPPGRPWGLLTASRSNRNGLCWSHQIKAVVRTCEAPAVHRAEAGTAPGGTQPAPMKDCNSLHFNSIYFLILKTEVPCDPAIYWEKTKPVT